MCNRAVPCCSSAERAGRLRSQAIQQCCFVCKVSRVERHLFSVGSASNRMGGASPSSSSPLKLTQGAACFTAFHCFALFKESTPLLCGLCQQQDGQVLAALLQLIDEAHVERSMLHRIFLLCSVQREFTSSLWTLPATEWVGPRPPPPAHR